MNEVVSVKLLDKAISEYIIAKIKMDSNKELMSTIVETTSEKTGMSKKKVARLFTKAYDKLHHPDKFKEEQSLMDDVYDLIEGVYGNDNE